MRELKIIGQLIYPEEAVTYEVATQLALSSFSNPELRDYLAKHFFDRIPEAPYWALDWIFTEHVQRWGDLLPVAFTILARWLSQGFHIEHEAHRKRLLSEVLEILSDSEVPFPTPLQRTALLMLKRWGRSDEALRSEVLASPLLKAWAEGEAPVQREFADDLTFEFEEFITNPS